MGTERAKVIRQTRGTAMDEPRKLRPIDIAIAIIVLGSLWGLAEVVFGGALKDR